jgi:hypothetical protein
MVVVEMGTIRTLDLHLYLAIVVVWNNQLGVCVDMTAIAIIRLIVAMIVH